MSETEPLEPAAADCLLVGLLGPEGRAQPRWPHTALAAGPDSFPVPATPLFTGENPLIHAEAVACQCIMRWHTGEKTMGAL